MIKTVIFDLGGVIVPLDFPRGYAAIEALSAYPAEEVPKRIGETGLVERLEKGQVEPEEFHRRICEALGMRVSFDEFRNLWSAIFPPHTLIPESLLESLRGRYGLLLLSNTNAIHFPFVEERYPLLRHFDDFVLSYKVGIMKPDPGIYHAAVERSGRQSAECLFIDDVIENVESARREGLDATQFVGYEQLATDLQSRAIEI